MLKLLLVGFKKKLYIEGPIKPWSLYLVKTRKYSQKIKNFDYLDSIFSNSVAIRMGDIGIILFLFDNSACKIYYPKIPIKFKTNILTKEQFRETAIFMFYKETLLNRVPWYMSYQNKKMIKIVALPIGGMSSKPVYDEWKETDYQKMRSSYIKNI
ncbi:hypothetical protein SDC9_117141 [bioreactor metagenome]|uniref:Uncharacterized protein n=1 Tax=bioreactor metagenome TaxID=1076179 RepID=A0A645BYJ3_9ZZZZ